MARDDDFDDDRSVMYIGPRAFVAAFGALCLTLLGVTYGAARITESMEGGAAPPATALLPWTVPPLTATPAPVVAIRSPLPTPRAAAPRTPARPADTQRTLPPLAVPARRLVAVQQSMPVHRLAAAPVPSMATPVRTAAPRIPAPKDAPAAVKVVGTKPHSIGLLVTVGSRGMAMPVGALAPRAPDASIMVPDASGRLQPSPTVAAAAPVR